MNNMENKHRKKRRHTRICVHSNQCPLYYQWKNLFNDSIHTDTSVQCPLLRMGKVFAKVFFGIIFFIHSL